LLFVDDETVRDNERIFVNGGTDSKALGKTGGQIFAKNETPRRVGDE